MARKQSTEEIRVDFVPAVSNIAAPTTTELNAGTPLSAYLLKDGLTTPQSGETVDAGDMSSRYNKTAAGDYGGDPINLKLYRGSVPGTDDVAWTTLPRTTTGFLAVRRFGGTTAAWASAQKVEIWPIEVLSREMVATAKNQLQQFGVMAAVPTTPNDNATVA